MNYLQKKRKYSLIFVTTVILSWTFTTYVVFKNVQKEDENRRN